MENLKPSLEDVVLTIGNFDGIHSGHQFLIRQLVDLALEKQAQAWVLTFDPHPGKVLSRGGDFSRLFDREDQLSELEARGIKRVIIQPFDRGFAELSPAQFLEDFLWKNFRPKGLLLGHDFRFGQGRKGDFALARSFGQKMGIEVRSCEAFLLKGQRVSSSMIRDLLAKADLNAVREYLGRNYYLRGPVVVGEGRGEKIGVPTVNIAPTVDFKPKLGVYISQVQLPQETQKRFSVTNIGINKTFNGEGSPVKVETHILDYQGDLYGKTVKIELLDFLREEKKFSSIEDLVAAIKMDIQRAKLWKK